MDAFSAYTVATSGWLAVQATPLLFTPSVLLPLLNDVRSDQAISQLAIYLARSLGLTLFAFSILSLLLSGLIPLVSLTDRETSPVTAFAGPVTIVTSLFHLFTGFYIYTIYASNGLTMYALGLAGSGFLGAWGVWTSLFGTDPGHFSKRTGKDKRVSGWPFGDGKARVTALKQN